MNTEFCKGSEDILELFENTLSPEEVLSAKLISQISTAITKERLRLGMTQIEFADYIDVTQSQISRWERGDYNFSIKKIAEIASKLNLDIDIFFSTPVLSETGATNVTSRSKTITFPKESSHNTLEEM